MSDSSEAENQFSAYSAKFPLLARHLGRDYFFSCINHSPDYYVSHPLPRWVTDSAQGLYDIERALEREGRTSGKLFYLDQFKALCEGQTLEAQQALLNEMVAGARMYNIGLQVSFRDRAEAGSDLVWQNADENREVHLEIITPQYAGNERKRLNAENPRLRKEREQAIKSGEHIAMTTSYVSPFGNLGIADQVDRIRDLKRSKNQVKEGDSGVQIVAWTLGLDPAYFEPIFFDRDFVNSGFIYHAYYGKRGAPLFKPGSVVDMFEEGVPSYSSEEIRTDGRFMKGDSKFSAAIYFDPASIRGVFLRNFSAPKALTRSETIQLVKAFDASVSPSRWLDCHAPRPDLGTKVHGG